MIERGASRYSVFTSVKDLKAAIRAFIDGWSGRFQRTLSYTR